MQQRLQKNGMKTTKFKKKYLKSGLKQKSVRTKKCSNKKEYFAERQLELPEELQHPQKLPHLIDKKFNIKQGEPDKAEVDQLLVKE